MSLLIALLVFPACLETWCSEWTTTLIYLVKNGHSSSHMIARKKYNSLHVKKALFLKYLANKKKYKVYFQIIKIFTEYEKCHRCRQNTCCYSSRPITCTEDSNVTLLAWRSSYIKINNLWWLKNKLVNVGHLRPLKCMLKNG